MFETSLDYETLSQEKKLKSKNVVIDTMKKTCCVKVAALTKSKPPIIISLGTSPVPVMSSLIHLSTLALFFCP